jgi:hypothetical protein
MHALDNAYEALKREVDAACSRSVQAARRQITNDLNQLLRRLRNYQGEYEWIAALLDSVEPFVSKLAVFEIRDGLLALRGQRNMGLPDDLSFSASSGRAFVSAIDSKDLVIALRSPAEVTEQLSSPQTGERAYLVPIVNGNRVAAVLFGAADGDTDVNALELVTGLASAVLERRSNLKLHGQIAELRTGAPESTTANRNSGPDRSPTLPSWADLSQEHRDLHIRAQRFARVTIAELELSRPEACNAGREKGDLYLYLNKEIERARGTYRKQFMSIPSMVDYLHIELVNTAAGGDETKLGADYPGQLV